MQNPTRTRNSAAWLAFAALASLACQTQAAGLNGGYSQNFDSMGTAGTAGTAAPDGWQVFIGPSGTSNSTWTTTIPASGVAALVASTGALTASTAPSVNNNNGYNAAASSTAAQDRVLASAPTSFSGGAFQLSLDNDTGAAVTGLSVSYDVVRFTAATTANELPGYWLFYSLDGSSWTNVTSFNPSLATVPNTVGVATSAGSFQFAAPVAAGASVLLRWVDDNAQQTSPDQIIGLNNVTLGVSPVPEPGSVALLVAGLSGIGLGALRKRRQA